MNKLYTLLFGLLTITTAWAQPKLIEKVEKTGDKLVIPYEKWQLSNGLTIVVHEDHSNPIVHVEITYHVGSAREVKDRTGFAHFFEHMMFQGSSNVRDEEHFKIVQGAGGTMNGTTNRDRTNYFETLPASYLETALWLESDRMGFLLDSVTQKKFEVQRATVKNEKGQNVENVPYGIMEEYKNKNLYPEGHPYSWTTIGYTEDLDRANVEDLRNFFLRWYGPNNAVLVISGDVVTSEVINMVDKYFGSIPQCPKVNKMKMERVILPETKFVYYSEKVPYPLYTIVYPSVPSFHKDEPALDILANILGQGQNSLLYKNIEKPENGLQTSANNSCEELAGEFTISVVPVPFTPIDSIKDWVNMCFNELEKGAITEEALQRAKSSSLSQLISLMESVRGKSYLLNTWIMFGNKTMNIQDEIDRYKNVTKEQVLAAYNKYIKNQPAVWVVTQPRYYDNETAPKTKASAENMPPVNIPDEYKNLTYRKAVDNFDRSKRPTPGPIKTVQIPTIYQTSFDNGLKIAGTVNNEVPLVYLQLIIKGGQLHEMKDMKKIGISSLVADMMNEGTKNYTAEDFSKQLAMLGSNISVRSGEEDMVIVVTSRTENLDATLKLFEERLLNSKFDKADFKRLTKLKIQELKGIDYNAGFMAALAFGKILYGNNIYGEFANEKIIKSYTIEDVQNYYNNYFSPSVSDLIIVSNLSKDQIIPKLDFLKKWEAKKVEIPVVSELYETEATRIVLIDKPDAPQSSIEMGYLSDKYNPTGKFFKNTIMNFQLGGSFNSRLNQNIREDKGYTYGIRSGFDFNNVSGKYNISCSVRGDATDSALIEIMKDVNNYKNNGITLEELEFTKNALSNSRQMRFETSGSMASFIYSMINYGVTPEVLKEQEKIIQSMTKSELDMIAKESLKTDKMLIVVVGDKVNLKKKLEKLNLGEVKVFNSCMDVPFNPKNRVLYKN